MLIRLLGQIGAESDGEGLVPAPGRVAAGVLAYLALAEGRQLSADALMDAVWDRPPESARNALQVAISKLRKVYGPDLIESSPAGYRLRSSLVRVDWDESRRLARDGGVAWEDGRARQGLAAAERALALFGGHPFTGWTSTVADGYKVRAEQLNADLRLLEARCWLALNNPSRAAELLDVLASEQPLAERVHAALMEALAASGRPAEALALYDRLRRRLADELGADPSPALQELFARLLADGATPTTPSTPRRVAPGRTKLPATASPLFGREEDVAAVMTVLESGHNVLTLLGPGGIGKTRLAIEVGRAASRRRQAPAIFVDLTAAQNHAEVVPAISGALEVAFEDWDVALADTGALVLLDNAEHVLDGVRHAVGPLTQVAGLSVLTTSRTPLRLRDEYVIPVDGLAAERPNDPALLLLSDRARLSASTASREAAALQVLAARADGMPLVLELLASALQWQTPASLVAHLDEVMPQITALESDRPRRHLSVEAAVSWSLEQASESARVALGALAIPRGGFDLDAATALLSAAVPQGVPLQLLSELLDLSLVQRVAGPGHVRFRMLEPLRLHSRESTLVPDPPDSIHRAHAIHLLEAATRAAATYDVTREAVDLLMDHEAVNVQQAVAWLWENDPETTAGYLGSLLFVWYYRDDDDNVVTWSERALLASAGSDLDRAQIALARLTIRLWQGEGTDDELEQLFALVRPHIPTLDLNWERRWRFCEFRMAVRAGDTDAAVEWIEAYPADSARTRLRKADLRLELFESDELREVEALAVAQTWLQSADVAAHPDYKVVFLNYFGYLALRAGRVSDAAVALGEALQLGRGTGLLAQTALVVNNLAWVALEQNRYAEAVGLVAENFDDPAVKTDTVLRVEGAVIVGLALVGLEQSKLASAIAAEVENLIRSSPHAIDTYAKRRLTELAAAVPAYDGVPSTAAGVAAMVQQAQRCLNGC